MAIVRHQSKARHNKRAAKPAKPLSQEIFQVKIHGLSHEAHGVSRRQDKVMFVPGALPEERVEVQLSKQGRSFDQGKLINVLQASEHRIEPSCEYYARCGACQLQHLAHPKQIEYKQAALDAQFSRHLKLTDLPWQTPLVGDGLHYRRRARLGIRYRKQLDEIIIGFREEANSHLTAIEHCPVLAPSLSDLIAPLHGCLSQLAGKSVFTQVELLQADNSDALILRHLKPVPALDVQTLQGFAQKHEVQLYLQGDEQLQCIFDNHQSRLFYQLQDNELEFQVKDFIQGNGTMNQKMVALAQQWLAVQEHEQVLDLFAGVGNFTLPIARTAKTVLAVEGQKTMVQRIERNAHINRLENIQAKTMNLADDVALSQLQQQAAAQVIILDPPRAGAAQIMPWLAKQQARILYVACEPSALLRDAQELLKAGFTMKKIVAMDMFPNSKHVETMALFEKD